MFDEMRFLISTADDISKEMLFDSSFEITKQEKYNIPTGMSPSRKIYTVTNENTKNYIKSDVNKAYNTQNNKNPYLDLLEFTNKDDSPKSLKLKAGDFAHLRDIGVFPINRLMILRRFPQNTVVPVDLNDLQDIEPISTVVGWVDKEEDFLKFSFNEVWEKQGSDDMLHKLLNRIMDDEFGIKFDKMVPIPGWGQGFLFGILHKMGLTDYGKFNLPIGDPNLLKESVTRPHEKYGLESNFSFNLKTSYEQKYIGGIDPTQSFMMILQNLLNMGTSNVNYLGQKGSDFLKKLTAANENPTDGGAWTKLGVWVIQAYIEVLGGLVGEVLDVVSSIFESDDQEDDDTADGDSTSTDDNEENKEQKDNKEETGQDKLEGILDTSTGFLEDVMKGSSFVQSILAATLARYQWPIRGSIAMFTGDSNTPWHLTIGNPYAPLLSMNNVKVDNVEVKLGNDLGHNDLPKIINVDIKLNQGRNLGKQEIFSYFGVRYKRQYDEYATITRSVGEKPIFEIDYTDPRMRDGPEVDLDDVKRTEDF